MTRKKAFWINIYNAYSQIYLSQPKYSRLTALQSLFFFEKRLFRVAGRKVSLNGVEHGILRRSRVWWSRGLLKKWFPSRYEKNFRVDRLDPRIHFALNCGAVSCPPIRFYEADQVTAQLDLATIAYLEQEVDFDRKAGLLRLPQLLWFYLWDFKGTEELLRFINRYGDFVDLENRPRIKYVNFDRSEKLNNFED